HHNALLTAGVYSLTIIIVLTAAMLLLGTLIAALANHYIVNLILGLVLTFFALALFGMYEMELTSRLTLSFFLSVAALALGLLIWDWIPGLGPRTLALAALGAVYAGLMVVIQVYGKHFDLTRVTSSREGVGGLVGAFFMALTFTITSFTCTGPFLGPILVSTHALGLSFGELVLSALVYSATFAAPFFVLALFPRLLKALPKSGGWLNSVKVVMGFLELAAA